MCVEKHRLVINCSHPLFPETPEAIMIMLHSAWTPNLQVILRGHRKPLNFWQRVVNVVTMNQTLIIIVFVYFLYFGSSREIQFHFLQFQFYYFGLRTYLRWAVASNVVFKSYAWEYFAIRDWVLRAEIWTRYLSSFLTNINFVSVGEVKPLISRDSF